MEPRKACNESTMNSNDKEFESKFSMKNKFTLPRKTIMPELQSQTDGRAAPESNNIKMIVNGIEQSALTTHLSQFLKNKDGKMVVRHDIQPKQLTP